MVAGGVACGVGVFVQVAGVVPVCGGVGGGVCGAEGGVLGECPVCGGSGDTVGNSHCVFGWEFGSRVLDH